MERSNKSRLTGRPLPTVAALGLLIMSSGCLAENVLSDGLSQCPPSELAERKDYRLRETTPTLVWKARDTYLNHLAPAVRRMDSGDFSLAVMADLDFLLARWPNHYPALQALIRYEAGGGRTDKYVSVGCYFQRANWFVPDDANIFVLNGVYRHRSGDLRGAEESWKSALFVDGQSAEAHYNLGLLYFEQEDFARAVEHAQEAYDLGYPLPGLKRKLMASGKWPN